MKKFLIAIVSVWMLFSCQSQKQTSLLGSWIEVMPANPQIVQGITLFGDSSAKSIGNTLLRYERWSLEGNALTLAGVAVANRTDVTFLKHP